MHLCNRLNILIHNKIFIYRLNCFLCLHAVHKYHEDLTLLDMLKLS